MAKFIGAPIQELIQYPGASWKSMNAVAGVTFNFLKGFRKTKSMIGRKDIRDNDDCQGLYQGLTLMHLMVLIPKLMILMIHILVLGFG